MMPVFVSLGARWGPKKTYEVRGPRHSPYKPLKMPVMTKTLLKTPTNVNQAIAKMNMRLAFPVGRARVATVSRAQKITSEYTGL